MPVAVVALRKLIVDDADLAGCKQATNKGFDSHNNGRAKICMSKLGKERRRERNKKEQSESKVNTWQVHWQQKGGTQEYPHCAYGQRGRQKVETYFL